MAPHAVSKDQSSENERKSKVDHETTSYKIDVSAFILHTAKKLIHAEFI